MDTTNNQNVFELAITLGKVLKQDARLVRMDAARKAYDEDPTLKQLMTEYDVQQKAIQQVASAEDFDPQLLQSIQNGGKAALGQSVPKSASPEVEVAE